MPAQAPKIDPRSYEQIVEQTERLTQIFSGWRPPSAGNDLGRALIAVFARMAEQVVERLNRVPEQNFLTFLELIGTRPLPPQAARAPLSFRLAADSPEDGFVPAGTQVSAPAAPGMQEVTFEIERDLVVTRAQLVATFVREPDADRYGDYSTAATGANDASFPAFAGDSLIEHSLYLAHDDFLSLPSPRTIHLTFALPDTQAQDAFAKLPLDWSYWDGDRWQPLTVAGSSEGDANWTIVIGDLPAPAVQTIDGRSARWLRARLSKAIGLVGDLPLMRQIVVGVDMKRDPTLPPPHAFTNLAQLDLSKDFYPFGERPRFNDTFYLASQEVFARPGAAVTMDVALSETSAATTAGNPQIAWEAWTGEGWQPIVVTDGTDRFTRSGTLQLTLPGAMAARTINGATGYWLRARLVAGNYGEEARYTTTEVKVNTPLASQLQVAVIDANGGPARGAAVTFTAPTSGASGVFANGTATATVTTNSAGVATAPLFAANSTAGTYTIEVSSPPNTCVPNSFTLTNVTGSPSYVLLPATFAPPSIQALRLGYIYNSSAPPQACLTRNDFGYTDQTASLASGETAGFTLFRPTFDDRPALYLGFDHPFANRPTLLYAQVEPAPYDQTRAPTRAAPPSVSWEYAMPDGWAPLVVWDETRAFAERGLVAFVGPQNLARRSEFGQERYWLRARWQGGMFRAPPRLHRLLTNTVWASQAALLRDQTLGSSDGSTSQSFRTTLAPSLADQRVEVHERVLPPPDERAAIAALEGEDAIIVDADGGPAEGAWVRWHAVTDFYGSGPRDRHYLFDYQTGEVRFGDGQHGLIPPVGRPIRITYRSGGGSAGNRPAETITQLKTALPAIDSVINYESASGGGEQEPLERVKERGPRAIRHGNRAVAAQDYEDLAREASPEIARALALPPHINPLDVQWLKPKPIAPGAAATGVLPANQAIMCEAPEDLEAKRRDEAGKVALIVVPRSDSPQPIPSLELLDQVEQYVLERCPAAIALADLQVVGPDWVKITVGAFVAPVALANAETLRTAVADALRRFLHPLTGGPDHTGWAFGRAPHLSDLYALIESIPGVDHIHTLNVQEEPEIHSLPRERLGRVLVYSGDHVITLVAPGEGN